ncbi:MAG: hypothetical protein COW30_02995 [Rhodospirillales bacterium CG15_BIG_FIL_POST_REV_8_21_14_020_66_15]|nr:MAG: hypothetical protein COW30_02995 [Rhodospirillales bacterium CG15_BIG_FIL_POST_REV_8_21_14_020_66_15]
MSQQATDMPTPTAETRPFRVMFVHAPDPVYSDTQTYGAIFMPVWAYTLAAHIPDDLGVELLLHDTRVQGWNDIAPADLYLFSGINQDAAFMNRVRARLKDRFPKARSMVGGPVAWSFEQAGTLEQLEEFDHIFVGDAEDHIAGLIEQVRDGQPMDPVIKSPGRFEIAKARPMHRGLMDATISRYYGAVIEVSRGCPFLCEFCDIRIMDDNNRPHNKRAELIVEELDHLCRLGVSQILFACDNFIGEPRWAEDVIDKILAWKERTGFTPSLYTWLTINLHNHPDLMAKMRRAGFDMLFIGIESFSKNSLLETAKVQNSSTELTQVVREIQSRGFIVVGGLIFGFDSDDDDCFDITLKGLTDAALLSGDPSLLTALPGTPLYRRMKLSKRLRDVRFGLGGYKYQTNIRYLLPRRRMIDGYKHFVDVFTDGAYQYARLKAFFDLQAEGNHIPIEGQGFGNTGLFLKMVLKNWRALAQLTRRMLRFSLKPQRVYYALKGFALAFSRRRQVPNWFGYFQFWLFAWTNAALKYLNLSDRDFDIESVPADFDIRGILPSDYGATAAEPIPQGKIKAQLRATTAQLESVIERKTAAG